uniref:Uncharacterized protein n=1 Tax=Arundo donax TaxID=35708 RepID=A0A0A8Y1G6_ARUDO
MLLLFLWTNNQISYSVFVPASNPVEWCILFLQQIKNDVIP